MSKYKEQAVVVAQERIATDIYSLWIQTANIAAEAGPGQFLSVYTRDESKLLPRPISICEVDKDKNYIRLVYRVTGKGTGTQQFAALKEGDQVAVMGPLGNGFMTNCPRKAFLIGGGIGIPPMLELAKQLDCEKQIIAGYRDELFLTEELKEYGSVYVATEDGSSGTKGNVLDAIRENGLDAEIIYACGPAPMLRALKAYAEEKNIPCYLSLEERMACGVGACVGCAVKTRTPKGEERYAQVCKNGPVFDAKEVVW